MTTTNDWVTHPRPNPQARLRLFCFPYAGGAASIFYPWPDDLPLDVAVCPIQLPGRENRLGEPLFTRISPLVQVLAQAIRPYLDLPFAFFGHSMGAIISFELARELCKRGDPGPVQLFASGNRAPQIACRDSPIHQLPEAEFIEEIRKFSGIPEAVLQNTEFLQLFLPILRADFAMHDTYIYTAGEPLACPISAFGGLQDKEVGRDDLAAWRNQTQTTFTLRMLPGDHFFLHNARTPLLHAISQDLCNSWSK
jgi:medium-chain acyl-[acyl-carrier-protein] hydrolase